MNIYKFLQYHDDPIHKYSQFTIDWIEENRCLLIEELNEEIIGAKIYEVENIIEIMNQNLKDFQFFKKLNIILRRLSIK